MPQTGNQSTSKRPMRTVKGTSKSYDNHALAGAAFFDPTMTDDEKEKIDDPFYGLGLSSVAENNTHPDLNGNGGWKSVDTGPPPVPSRKIAGGGDPTPGGGFED